MRLSTSNSYDAGVDSLTQRQRDLSAQQQRLTSGKRVLRASDDPAAAARAERANAAVQRDDASKRAVESSRTMMTLAESSLGSASDLLQQAREALVAAGNASYSDAERLGVANKLANIRTQLLNVANRDNGNGGYLFGGQGVNQAPFVDAPGGVQFQGTPGQLNAASGEPLPLSVDGAQAWMSAPTGNGVFETRPVVSTGAAWIDSGQVVNPSQLTNSVYSVQFTVSAGVTTYNLLKDGSPTSVGNAYKSGQAITIDGQSFRISGQPADGDTFESQPSTNTQSVFAVMDKAIADLKTPLRSSSAIAQANVIALRDLDSVATRMGSVRAHAGEALNQIDSVSTRLEDLKLASQSVASDATDLDMINALADFQTQQTGYDAALKTYAMVQRMSLFQYLQA